MSKLNIFNRWGDVSIRTRLAISFTVLIVLISAYNFLYFPGELAKAEKSAIRSKAETMAELVAGNVCTAQFFGDTTVAAEVVSVAMRNEDVVFVEIRDTSGALFLSQRKPSATPSPGTEPLIVPCPVIRETHEIGVVRLGVSLDRATERISHIRALAAGHGIVLFIVGALLVFGVSTAITRPLGHMALTAERIASGDHTQRVRVDRNDEAGHLGSAINAMLDALNGAEQELIELSLHLEERVIDRTTALERANTSLVAEVHEREKVEESLRKAKFLAEEASHAKSDFLANMSHEIRTPMNGIIGMTELALRTNLTNQQQKYLGTVRSSAETLLVVINEILDFSKIEAGKLVLETTKFDLRETVGDVVKGMGVLGRARHLELMCDIASDVPQILLGDPARLAQVLNNLIGNALKFTEHGEVILRVITEPRSEDRAVLGFSVIDSGVGIPSEKLNTIFEPFTQADLSTTRKYGGTGLGLTICSRLLHLMGGTIRASSAVGVGSTFSFSVPFGVASEPIPGVGRAVDLIESVRVAVVDHNPTNRKILIEMLRQWQMFPLEVERPQTLPDVLVSADASGEPIHLVVIDSHLPEGGGFELARTIEARTFTHPPRFLILTSGEGDVGGRSDYVDPTMICLEKPFKQSELLEAIQTVLGNAMSHTNEAHREQEFSMPGRPLRILVAEDHPVNQELVLGILGIEGHAVTLAKNGREAIEILQNGKFDIVLMDVQMPEMDGYQATAAIRELERHTGRHIPVIAMTAHAMKGDREKCLAAGMDDYISKPIRVATLQKVLQMVQLDGGESARTVRAEAPPSGVRRGDSPEFFDESEARRQCLGNDALLWRVVKSFLDTIPGSRQVLQMAATNGNLTALAKAAHALKGAAGSIVAQRCHKAALAVERTAKGGNLERSKAVLEILWQELDTLETVLSGSVENRMASSSAPAPVGTTGP
jgi:signal transduction histidine kinase/CheY-like chemotaxis protein/HPt (histidine-containing phosphotransfer) domain-containing protein